MKAVKADAKFKTAAKPLKSNLVEISRAGSVGGVSPKALIKIEPTKLKLSNVAIIAKVNNITPDKPKITNAKMAKKTILGKLFQKGGLISNVAAGIGNAALSKISGGLITNVFKTSKPANAEEQRVENNSTAVLDAIGTAAGSLKATYQPQTAIVSTSPFSSDNATKSLYKGAESGFLSKYMLPILGGVTVLILSIFLIIKKK